MLPDTESLRCFVEAARTLNFRAASRAVGLTPAAFGQRIKGLEEQLGVDLFVRTTRRVELTEAGLAMLSRAQETLTAAADSVRAARGELGPAPVDITIGTRHELGLSWVQPSLPLLESRFPHVTFHLYFGSGEDLSMRVHRHEIDCAISSRRVTEPEIEGVRIHREDYVFVSSKARLEKFPFEKASDANNHVIVDTETSLPLFHYLAEVDDRIEASSFKGFRQMGTIAAIHQCVLAGDGVAVLPRYLIHEDLEQGTLVRLLTDVVPQHDWFRFLYRVDDPRSGLYRAMASVLSESPLR
jgi:LysR family glycine cleavage system transcriptional activator